MTTKSTAFTSNLLHQPRRIWLRKAVFQVHLWVGLLAALYLVVISLSGSVLVFKDELMRSSLPASLHPFDERNVVPPDTVLRLFQQSAPGAQVSNLQFPSRVMPAFLLDGKDRQHTQARWIADPQTGRIVALPRTWMDWTHDLHYYLLLPHAWGMQVNGVGAVALLLLAASGLVLWWPGVRVWTRGLRVNFKARWRRINYDLHSAIGFWTLAIVVWWAFSGIYFAWYRQVASAISVVSPIRGMKPPQEVSPAPALPREKATLTQVLAVAQAASPDSHRWSISNPQLDTNESTVLLDRAAPGDFSHRDIVRVSRDGRVLSVWHYGERHSLADWLLWSMHPLHFGTLWGLSFKILWATLGLTLVCLTVTGTLLYWNRFLSHHWRKLCMKNIAPELRR